MNVGYYFHPPAVFGEDGSASVEPQYGIFLRALAQEAGELTFFAHSGHGGGTETMALRAADGIRCVDLGPRRRRPLMYLRPGPSLRAYRPRADRLDAMLVRGPTSLLPAIARRSRREGVPMVSLLVADNRNWRGKVVNPGWRNALIRVWLWWQARAQMRAARTRLTLAISKSIVRDRSYRRSAVVPTTTLVRADLTGPAGRTRAWPDEGERVRGLFTGRLAEEKGLFELGDALADLVAKGRNVEIELVGPTYGDQTIERVLDRAAAAGVADRLIVSGYLEAGPALLAAYQRADFYVLPTYGEGSVSRSIKEAFATGLPVVTTGIREIREFLTDGEHAVLVEATSAESLASGVARLLDDAALRERIAANAFEWVQDYTNEASAAIIIGHLRSEIARGKP